VEGADGGTEITYHVMEKLSRYGAGIDVVSIRALALAFRDVAHGGGESASLWRGQERLLSFESRCGGV
jgi:hypothetical protein